MNLRHLALAAVCAVASLSAWAATSPSPRTIPDSYLVTFAPSTSNSKSLITKPDPNAQNKSANKVAFGEHSTGQSKDDLARSLKIKGKVNKIFETINAAHLLISDAEANALRKDPRVLSVEPDLEYNVAQTVQMNPGWALDRLDQTSQVLNNQYFYNSNGAGRTIYIIDSGLDLNNPNVAAEFGGRASFIYDVNNGTGNDCMGHGTQTASAAAGRTYGVAKGALIRFAKITVGCGGGTSSATSIMAFNWLAANAPRGTIANWSFEYAQYGSCTGMLDKPLEDSIKAAHDAGIIVVVAAGNDGCDTANYSPTRIPEAFVVGATSNTRFVFNQDALYSRSRFGTNISTFAPGENVALLNFDGKVTTVSGTSFAAPYMAGVFAAACQVSVTGNFCDTMVNAGVAYTRLRGIAVLGSVVNADGTALPFGTNSRFINRSAW